MTTKTKTLSYNLIFVLVFQSDYASFSCPTGYVFEDSNNITNYAFCLNTTWIQMYDEKKLCVRKYSLHHSRLDVKIMLLNFTKIIYNLIVVPC